jgi:hypothetical protein
LQPAWIQTSLRIRAVWSGSMLFALTFSICYTVCKQTAWILIRLYRCTGWSGSMLVANPLYWFCRDAAHITLWTKLQCWENYIQKLASITFLILLNIHVLFQHRDILITNIFVVFYQKCSYFTVNSHQVCIINYSNFCIFNFSKTINLPFTCLIDHLPAGIKSDYSSTTVLSKVSLYMAQFFISILKSL